MFRITEEIASVDLILLILLIVSMRSIAIPFN